MNKEELNEAVQGLEKQTVDVTNSAAERVIQELELKYGIDFKIAKVGGRIDSDSFKFYLNPKDNASVVFKAILDSQTNTISDDYIGRCTAYEFDDFFEKRLNENGVIGSATVYFIHQSDEDEDDSQITLKDYFEKYSVQSAFIYLALDKNSVDFDTAEKLILTCISVGDNLHIEVAVNGVVIGDRYEDCTENIKNEPEISSTWFDLYSPLTNYHFVVIDGQSNKSIQELQKELAGE